MKFPHQEDKGLLPPVYSPSDKRIHTLPANKQLYRLPLSQSFGCFGKKNHWIPLFFACLQYGIMRKVCRSRIGQTGQMINGYGRKQGTQKIADIIIQLITVSEVRWTRRMQRTIPLGYTKLFYLIIRCLRQPHAGSQWITFIFITWRLPAPWTAIYPWLSIDNTNDGAVVIQ